MLKTKTITIDKGRDAGQTYIVEEMPVAVADRWAMRAGMELLASNFDGFDPQEGMLGMAKLSLQALRGIDKSEAITLLDELLDCVKFVPEGGTPRKLDVSFGDVQDFSTLWTLRKEVFSLHIDFLLPALGQTSVFSQEPVEKTV